MRTLFALTAVLVLASCSYLPTSKQYPALAMNSGWCAVMGSSIAMALSAATPIMAAVTAGAGAVCSAESSLVAGPPSQVTQTTVVQNTSTKVTP